MIVIAIIAILAAILIPNFIRARAQAQLSACEGNLKNSATALEMYATDYNGNYPLQASGTFNNLGTLVTPIYLKSFPLCPAVASNTTNATYSYATYGVPPAYDLYHAAANHSSIGVTTINNKPALFTPLYSAQQGLLTK